MRKSYRAIINFFKNPIKIILLMFFDKKYIVGRHFDDGLSGYVWAISAIWQRNILRLSKPMPFPVSVRTYISNYNNVIFHPDDINNFQSPGVYMQNISANIIIGRGSYIGPNVGIITSNHDLSDLKNHIKGKDVELGVNCWIGMNSVLLPGVKLGNKTIVGAGSVVTKSFVNGNCIIAGNPAIVIRDL